MLKKTLLISLLSFLLLGLSTISSLAEEVIAPATNSNITYSLSSYGIVFKKKPLPTEAMILVERPTTVCGGVVLKDFHTKTFFTSKKKIFRKLVDAEKYPFFTFTSKVKNPIFLADNASFILDGEITFHGVTKDVIVILQSKILGNKLQLTGEYKIKMTEFGIDPPRILFAQVDDEITTNLDLLVDIVPAKD